MSPVISAGLFAVLHLASAGERTRCGPVAAAQGLHLGGRWLVSDSTHFAAFAQRKPHPGNALVCCRLCQRPPLKPNQGRAQVHIARAFGIFLRPIRSRARRQPCGDELRRESVVLDHVFCCVSTRHRPSNSFPKIEREEESDDESVGAGGMTTLTFYLPLPAIPHLDGIDATLWAFAPACE